MLTMKNIAKTAQGRLTIHTVNGSKVTLSINCSRANRSKLAHQAVTANGRECTAVTYLWNGEKINL